MSTHGGALTLDTAMETHIQIAGCRNSLRSKTLDNGTPVA
jgi:hypothetical protein